MRVALVTGSSGFIGYFLCRRLLSDGFKVVGLDNMSDYYDVGIKRRRQNDLAMDPNFIVYNDSIESAGLLTAVMRDHRPDVVVHLAAQAGVRHSIDNPRLYLDSNIVGTFELLEAARAHPPRHMLLASTSSAYGANTNMPYHETVKADHQVSFYAATKKATEVMAHSYSHLFDLPITMFRFFTVYGPWGRPDMAYFKFTDAILHGKPIDVYNFGDMSRDFTYVEDLVEAIRLLLDAVPVRAESRNSIAGDSLSPVAPWRVVNIGNSTPVLLTEFIGAIEAAIGKKAQQNLLPMQAGDVAATWADVGLLRNLTGYVPNTKIGVGIKAFVEWYRAYYNV